MGIRHRRKHSDSEEGDVEKEKQRQQEEDNKSEHPAMGTLLGEPKSLTSRIRRG
jgi:hypothetical protein